MRCHRTVYPRSRTLTRQSRTLLALALTGRPSPRSGGNRKPIAVSSFTAFDPELTWGLKIPLCSICRTQAILWTGSAGPQNLSASPATLGWSHGRICGLIRLGENDVDCERSYAAVSAALALDTILATGTLSVDARHRGKALLIRFRLLRHAIWYIIFRQRGSSGPSITGRIT
jgi:hypothetical protein